MMMNINMRNDCVLVKRIPLPLATKAGIILPTRAQELPQLALVVAIGPENPENIGFHDMVLVMKFAGTRWERDDGDYYILRINELLAVLQHGSPI